MDHNCITQRQEAKANIFQIMSHLVGNHAVADVTSLATAGDKVYFRPSLFYQEVREFHIVDSGLEFKMDFETNVNHARFPNTVKIEENSSRLQQMKEKACTIVGMEQQRDDSENLLRRIKNAATWNDIDMVKTLVSTCYVTKAIAIPALLEAISNGHEELVEFLVLKAKTPTTEFCSKCTMKNPLHIAAENGHENILNFLLSTISTFDECMIPTADATSQTIIDILRNNDMGMKAKRILKVLEGKAHGDAMNKGGI